ncbi:serine/threonine-protein kinase [Pseudobacteriovorax antillogorgiicola]|uniref:AAA ATPase domain-containing protein n=1 Tax=Pseudobacteriovorax antillogorgiicola TaxID=1513793 RepID=A0A1Y6BU06_9BACT|nr:serine/threonine-protein kinase [Pseudobacteriovorax antillogorgiicola]TCS53874.1 AAA ATPase-like protein [Pseudobacteriovorax antillogorgiicola]SMF21253.1 AAA ATPase domain-containing protein [Pseudobacteriovorax antillogorgiicola]
MARNSKLIGAIIADRYCITNEIGAGGMGRVYSAIPFDDPSQNVAIKVIVRDRKLNYEDLLRFQKEAALMSRLHHPNIISFHELGLIEPGASKALSGGYYIVMEIAQGQDLKKTLQQGRQDLEFFFQVGLQVSSALEYTHSKNIIHRDIKPQNIIVGGSLKEDDQNSDLMVKVLDFGVAKLAEINQFEGARDIAGTPMYMAPETSEYLDAPVDHRSDLYALGCVVYEILAGRPPFAAGSKDKLAREHAYTKPEPISTLRPEVPDYINDIVLKLLAKHPNDRYQTAFGLHVDLQKARRCFHQGLAFFDVSTALARYDGLRIMTGSLDLIGREKEFQLLVDNYTAISKGRGRSRLSVVHGEAGSGKSRLLNEMRSYLAKHKIRYVSTSFSRHENNLPFNALANGLNEYLIKVLKSQQLEAEEIRSKVKALLGNTADLVAKVVPGLKPYIYDHIEDVELGAHDELDRDFDFPAFAKAFSDFTRCLTSDNQPIVFIFDDMHWADQKSIELVDRFFSHNNSQRFYLIVSYSEGASHDQEHFHRFVQKFEKLRRRYSEVHVGALEPEAVGELTRIMLNTEQQLESDLVGYLTGKTKGNPLYLVELVRSLVAKDFISLDETSGVWSYDTKAIKNTKVLLDSIDLTLNRVLEYDSVDQSVLEVASVVGTSFHFEMLMTDASLQAITVMRALQRAMSDYLIVRSNDIDDLKHLGKSFAFSHHRIRESIKDAIPLERRQELHKQIALKLQSLLPEPLTQTVFTLAHHFNQALGENPGAKAEAQQDIVMLAFKYNVMAGEKAYEIRALVSAERYFRNAYKLFHLLDSNKTANMKKHVLNKLGDVLGTEKQYSQAIKFYGELLHFNPTRSEFSAVTYKMIYFGMLNGVVSESLTQLDFVLKRLKMPLARPHWSQIIRLYLQALIVAVFGEKSSILRKLNILAKSLNKRRDLAKEGFHPVKLYHLGQAIALTQNRKLALAYHWRALRLCLRGKASPDAVLRTFGDLGIILGYFGFKKAAYYVVDEAIALSKKEGLERTYGYLLSMRTLTLDHFQGKFEDYEANITEAMRHVSYENSQQLIVQGILFRMYQHMTKGRHEEVAHLVKQLPLHLRTRHWLSPRGVCIYLFSLLLKDAREQIVLHKGYLKRREEVGARRQGLFLFMAETIIFFSMGEIEKAYTSYLKSLKTYTSFTHGFMFPYEEDFTMIFLLFFPSIFTHEYQNFDWDMRELKDEFRYIDRRASQREFQSRPAPCLVQARLEELLVGKATKVKYDRALKASRVSQDVLVELITQYWFGRHLLKDQQMSRKEYIYKMHMNARNLGLSMLENMAASVLEEYKFPVPGSERVSNSEDDRVQNQLSRLGKEAIALTHGALSKDLPSVDALNKSLRALRRNYSFKFVHLILEPHLQQENPSPFSSDKRSTRVNRLITDYAGSYMAVRSTLFIPEGDAPWNRDDHELSASTVFQGRDGGSSISLGNVEAPSEDMEDTMVLEGTVDIAGGSNQEDKAKSRDGKSPSLNTLVPVKYANQNLGIVLLEKTELDRGDSTQSRQDLDYFGAYLGLWLRYDTIMGKSEFNPNYYYRSGHSYIENCPWLDMWPEGSLRGSRESTWYLGLALSTKEYLLVYCRLNGIEEIREDISQRVWYHLLAMRSLFVAKDKKVVSWEDLHEEIAKVLYSTDRVRRLEAISIAFSIMNRDTHDIISGHFGPSRPLVLGRVNEVVPQDRVVLNMMNGRSLRFWRVETTLEMGAIYILTHDSSKLDEIQMQALEKVNFFGSSLEKKRQTFLLYLKQVLVAGHVPRYFVAATRHSGQTNLEQLDKAE